MKKLYTLAIMSSLAATSALIASQQGGNPPPVSDKASEKAPADNKAKQDAVIAKFKEDVKAVDADATLKTKKAKHAKKKSLKEAAVKALEGLGMKKADAKKALK